jgi:NitT/TauT family transport system substrate-binding protein
VKRDFFNNIYFSLSRYGVLLFILLMPLLAINCTTFSPQKPPLDEVTLQLKWTHRAQFAGFYMADDKGYYRDENIKVIFLEGGEDINNAQRVLSGMADFGVLSPELILINRSQEEPLLAIATIYRYSDVLFVSMSGSGIVKPSGMVGRTIAVKSEFGALMDLEIQFRVLMKKLGLDYSKCNIVDFDPTYETFNKRETDVTATYATGGLIKIRQDGYQVNTIWPSDYGIHFYSDTLTTTDRLIREKPDLVTRFLRASLKGWQDAIKDYEQAVSVTMKYVNDSDIELQTAMMEAQLPLIHTGEDRVGWMSPAIWQDMYNVLLDEGLLPSQFNVGDAYTMRFLESIYGAESQ